MSIINSFTRYIGARGRLMYGELFGAMARRPARGRRRGSNAWQKYVDMMEPRVLMTTVVGGQTFTFTDAHGVQVTATVTGNAAVELVGARLDSQGQLYYGDLAGAYNKPTNGTGTIYGNGSTLTGGGADVIGTASAAINIPGVSYPVAGITPGNQVTLSALAAATNGKMYAFNVFGVNTLGQVIPSNIDSSQSMWTIQIVQVGTNSNTTVALTVTGDDESLLLPIGITIPGGPTSSSTTVTSQTETKLYTDVRIAAAAFNPIDGKLYFDVHYSIADKLNTSTQVGSNSATTTSSTYTTTRDEIFSWNTILPAGSGTNNGISLVGLLNIPTSGQGGGGQGAATPALNVTGMTFQQNQTDPTTARMFLSLEPPAVQGQGGGGQQNALAPQLWTFNIQSGGSFAQTTVLNGTTNSTNPETQLTQSATVALTDDFIVNPTTRGRDPMANVVGLTTLPGSEPGGGNGFIFAAISQGSSSHLSRIDVSNGIGMPWGDLQDLAAPDTAQNATSSTLYPIGQAPVGLTYNPAVIDPFTGRLGSFLMLDNFSKTETTSVITQPYLLEYANHNFRINQGDLFAVYSDTSDINAGIAFQSATAGSMNLGYNGEWVENSTQTGFRAFTGNVPATALQRSVGVFPGVVYNPSNFNATTSTPSVGVYFNSTLETPVGGSLAATLSANNAFGNVRGLAISPTGTIAVISNDNFLSGDTLGLVNPTTGRVTGLTFRVHLSNNTQLKNVDALAYGDPNLNGNFQLYAIYEINGQPTLGTIDISTGIFSPVSGSSIFGAAGNHARVYTMMFSPGGTPGDPTHQTLYIIADPNYQDNGTVGTADTGTQEYLYQLDPLSGSLISTAPTYDAAGNVTAAGGIGPVLNGAAPVDAVAALFDISGAPMVYDRRTGSLMSLDLTTGAAGSTFKSKPGAINSTVRGLALDPSTLSVLAVDNETAFFAEQGVFDSAILMRINDLTANIQPHDHIGFFLFDGSVTGTVTIPASIEAFYAYNLNATFTAAGDVRNLMASTGIAGSVTVQGKIGQINSLGTITATIRAKNQDFIPNLLDSSTFTNALASSFDGYSFNMRGSATMELGNFGYGNLTLTDNSNQAGSAFLSSPRPIDNFQSSFDITSFGVNSFPDGGVAFVLQNQGQIALGGSGSGLGYAGILHSAAIAFNFDPTTGNSGIALGTGGQIGAYTTIPNLSFGSGDTIRAAVSYSGTTLVVTLVDENNTTLTFTKSYSIDLATTLSSRGAYIGFTGSSGTIGNETFVGNFALAGDNGASPVSTPQHRLSSFGYLESRFPNGTISNAQYLGTIHSAVAGQPDVIHLVSNEGAGGYFGFSMLAGQTVTVQVRPTIGTTQTFQHSRVINPDGFEVINDVSFVPVTLPGAPVVTETIDSNSFNTSVYTDMRPMQVTADRPGTYFVEVDTGSAFELTITGAGVGDMAIGAVAAASGITLKDASFAGVAGTPGILADKGDIGTIIGNAHDGTGNVIASGERDKIFRTNTSLSQGFDVVGTPVGDVTVVAGNLRAIQGANIGAAEPTPTPTQPRSVTAMDGPDLNINGVVGLISGVGRVDAYFGNAASGDIQLIHAGGDLSGVFRTDKAIGVIQAGSVVNNNSTNGTIDALTEFHTDVDRSGEDGNIDLIDVTGDWGGTVQYNNGTFRMSGAPLITGPGGNIRFMRIGGYLSQDTAFNSGEIPGTRGEIKHDPGAYTFVDDSGAVVRLIPGNITTTTVNGTVSTTTTTPGQVTTREFGVRGAGGKVMVEVDTATSLTIDANSDGNGHSAEIGQIVTTAAGSGITITNGVPTITANGTNSVANDITLSSTSNSIARLDVYDIEASGMIDHLRNTTPLGDFFIINATTGNLGVISALANVGVLSTQNTSTGTALLPTTSFGDGNPFYNVNVGVRTNGSLVQLSAGKGIGAILVGTNASSNSVIGTITANSDNVDDPNTYEGLTKPIVVRGSVAGNTASASTAASRVSINQVNIGEGVAPSLSLTQDGFAAGIYAVGSIEQINGNGGDIRGNVISQRHIGTINLVGGSIINTWISVLTSFNMANTYNVGTISVPDFTQTLETPVYNLDNVTISGGGGIIGSMFFDASINTINVKSDGFGIFESLFSGSALGTFNSISAGGYGIRDVKFRVSKINGIAATGTGAAMPLSAVSPRVRTSEQNIINPFDNLAPSILTDVDLYLFGDGINWFADPYRVTAADPAGLTTGVISYVNAHGEHTLGNVTGYDLSDSNFLFPGGTGAINIGNDVFDSQFVTGKISSVNVGRNAYTFEVTAAGAIGPVTIGGTFLSGTDQYITTLSQILAKGFNGTIASISSKGQFGGLIQADGRMGTITVGTPGVGNGASSGDLFGTVTIGGNGITGSVLDLLKIYGSFNGGVMNVNGNVTKIDVAHDMSVPQPVAIHGDLANLLVGTDPAVNGSVLSSSVAISGNLLNLTVTGVLSGSVVAQGGMTKLSLNSDTATLQSGNDLLTGSLKLGGSLTSGTIAGNVTGELLAGGMGSLTVTGNLLGGILSGKSISSATINGNVQAGSSITSALGDISKLTVTGNINGAISAPNGALSTLVVNGSIGSTGSIMVRTLGALTIPGSVAGTISATLTFASLKVGSVTSTGYISSPILPIITATGDLNGILNIGTSATAIKIVVGKNYGATGTFGAPLSITIAGSMTTGSTLISSSAITSVGVKGSLQGDIISDKTIGAVSALSVNGAVIAAGFGLTSLTVTTSIFNSLIETGLARGVDNLFGTSDLGEQARMADIGTILAGVMANSIIAAGGNINSLKTSGNMSSSTVTSGLVLGGSEIAAVLADATPLADINELHAALQGTTLLRGSIKTASIGATGNTMLNSTLAAGVSPGADGVFGTGDDNTNSSVVGGISNIAAFKGLLDGTSLRLADSTGSGASTPDGYTLDGGPNSIVPSDPVSGSPTIVATPGVNAVIPVAGHGTLTISISGGAGASVTVYDDPATTDRVDTIVISGPSSSGATVTITTTSPGSFGIGRVLTTDNTQLNNFTFNGDLLGDVNGGPSLWIDSGMTAFTVRNIATSAAWNGVIGGDVSKMTITGQVGVGRLRIGGRITTLTIAGSSGNAMLQQLGSVTPATFITQMAYDPTTGNTTATDGNNLLDVNVNNGTINSVTAVQLADGTALQLSSLAYDNAGNLYGVAAFNNLNPVQQIGNISPSSTTGSMLRGLAVTSSGTVYAIDTITGVDTLVMLDTTTGAETTVGVIRRGSFTFTNNVQALAIDGSGNILALVNDLDGSGGQFTTADGMGLAKIVIGNGGAVSIGNPTATGLAIPHLNGLGAATFTGMAVSPDGTTIFAIQRVGSTDELDEITTSGTGTTIDEELVSLGTVNLDAGATDTSLAGIGFDENGSLVGLNITNSGSSSELIGLNPFTPAASVRLDQPNLLTQGYNGFALGKSGTNFTSYAYVNNGSVGTFYQSPGVVSTLGRIGADGSFTELLPLAMDAAGHGLTGTVRGMAVDPNSGNVFVITDGGQVAAYSPVDGSLVGNAPLGVIKDSLGNKIDVPRFAFGPTGQLVGLNPDGDNLVSISTTPATQNGTQVLLASVLTEPGTAPHADLSGLTYSVNLGEFISYSANSGNFVGILGTDPDLLGGVIANSLGTLSIPDAFSSRIATTGNGIANTIDSIKFIGTGTFTGDISSAGRIGAVAGTGLTFNGFLVSHGDMGTFTVTGSVGEPGVVSVDGRITTLTLNGGFDGALFAGGATTINLNGSVGADANIEITHDVTTLNVTGQFAGIGAVGSVKILKVTGILASGSSFTVLGDVGTVTLGASQLGSTLLIDQNATLISIGGAMGGVVGVRRNVGTATLNNLNQAVFDVGGDITTKLTITGNANGSVLSSGTWIGADGVYNTADDVLFGGSIKTVAVGGIFTDSLIIAGVLPQQNTTSLVNHIPASYLAYSTNTSTTTLTVADIDSAESGGIAPSSIGPVTFSKPVVSSFLSQGRFSGLIVADTIGKVTSASLVQKIFRTDPLGAPKIVSTKGSTAGDQIQIVFDQPLDTATINSLVFTVVDAVSGTPITDLTFGYVQTKQPDGTYQSTVTISSASKFAGSTDVLVTINGGVSAPTLTDRTGLRSALNDYNQDGVRDPAGDPFGTTFTTQSVELDTTTNDNFAHAFTLPSIPDSVTGNTTGSTSEAGEPDHAGVSNGAEGQHSLWYKWVATFTGPVIIDTIHSGYDTTVGVYTGTAVNNLTEVASNDDIDFGIDLDSRVQFNAVSGTTYYIAVDGYQSAVGTFVLNIHT